MLATTASSNGTIVPRRLIKVSDSAAFRSDRVGLSATLTSSALLALPQRILNGTARFSSSTAGTPRTLDAQPGRPQIVVPAANSTKKGSVHGPTTSGAFLLTKTIS